MEELLASEGAQDAERAAETALELLDAVAACHAERLVHRDVKPGNVMVRPGGEPVLVDFGLVADPRATLLTRTGEARGTPLYMAPEVLRGVEAGATADLWGVGLILYELLTGRRAFLGRHVTALIARAPERNRSR